MGLDLRITPMKTNMIIKSAVLTLFITFPTLALAHPVAFKGAISVMSYNTPEMNELMLTYSVSPQFAIAGFYLIDSQSEFHIPRLNFLLKRWNNENSQGNIYLSGGRGNEKFSSKNHAVDLAEIVADWESRKYYIYFNHLYLQRDNKQNPLLTDSEYNHSILRVGTAPFLADYNDLNVWLILQAEKHLNFSNIEMTQILRFYIKNTLWEIGARFDGGGTFNYMVHF
jgi:hypothetical protein